MNFNPQTEASKIIDFIKNTFDHTHKSTAMIGLSGGIDSAVSFALTLQALGPNHIHAYFLPAKTTPPEQLQDIQLLTSNLGPASPARLAAKRAGGLNPSHFHIIPIKGLIQKSWRVIKLFNKDMDPGSKPGMTKEMTAGRDPSFQRAADAISPSFRPTSRNLSEWIPDQPACAGRVRDDNKLRLANLASRIRMMILFDQAKKLNGLVIGTENRSETLLGYFTRFGDQASDLEPIAHLYKTQVIKLAKMLNIPQTIIDKPPSADLWAGQTDEAELGFSYQEADPILMQLDQGQTPTGDLATKVITKVRAADFKHHVPYTI